MAMILKVGDYNQMAPVPRSFPTCYDYSAPLDNGELKSATALLGRGSSTLAILFMILLIAL
jgi:hypothetical protein